MKDKFPGHFKEGDAGLKKTWKASLFVFDANILLNLYRYSDTTRNEFLRILKKIKNTLWLPHRAAEEYLDNRLTVIEQQERAYEETIKSIVSLKADLENARQHPFVSKRIMDQTSSIFDELCRELRENKSVHTNRIESDEIKRAIAEIFTDDNVGVPYSKKRMEDLVKEGEERYRQKIPPGFKDGSKAGESEVFSEICRKYGDLIVWNQVIDKAIELNQSVVLVTDDRKDDWWHKFKGKTIGPRPELVKEFRDRTGQSFHMYQADRFLELARENLGEKVSDEIVEEVREVRRRDRVANRNLKDIEEFRYRKLQDMQLKDEAKSVLHQMASYEREIQVLQDKLDYLEIERDALKKSSGRLIPERDSGGQNGARSDYYNHLSRSYDDVNRRLELLHSKYRELRQYMYALDGKMNSHEGEG